MAKKQRTLGEAYRFVVAFFEEHHVPPSIPEVMEGMKISSTSVASYWMSRLVEARLATWGDTTTRRLRLVGGKWTFNPPKAGALLLPIDESPTRSSKS